MAFSWLGQSGSVIPRRNGWAASILVIFVLAAIMPNATALATRTLHSRAQIASGVELRVLPIGDSITWGAQSSDDAGYRKYLYDMLVAHGNKVDFVGSVQSGTDIGDDDHEGHRGETIEEIAHDSLTGIYAAANIILLHAGTNDMKGDIDVTNAPSRLADLIDLIFKHSDDAVLLVCQIIPSTTGAYQTRINNFNAALPAIVDGYLAKGRKVALVAMNDALSTADLADNLHPNDGGYKKMADAYYAAITAADANGWISEPGEYLSPPADSTSPESCKATPSWYNAGRIATGAKVATSDGLFQPSWYKKGVIAEGACPRARLHFMDLDGDGLKDYACVDPKTGAVDVWLNIPDADGKSAGNWNKLGEVATGATGRDGWGVMFADLNGDGRDDYIYIDPDTGAVSAWINRLKNDAGVWQWQSLGQIAGGVGATNETLQMVDIDGDGRADFCIVDLSTGEVTAWLNTGADIMPDYYKLGVIASGGSAAPGTTVYLGDFTGEGRADYMIAGEGGKVKALVNRLHETTLIPRWLEVFILAEGPDGAEQDQVRLVDMTGDGRVDYLLVDEKTGKVTLWENNGTGGKYQPGEGVILCDLDGDGTSDYFWVDHTGKGWGYLNRGKGTNNWNDLGQIAFGNHKRENIRMARLTSSGRADYVVLDDTTGRAEWFENLGPDQGWGWRSRGEIAAGPKNTIETQFGWQFKVKNVRFADLDGDGLDDYVYVNDQGATVMWRFRGLEAPFYEPATLVADGVGVLAQQVQFADTNGDGLLDYVVVGSTTGSARTWHHLGFRDDGSIRWNTPLSFADGMTGNKRADYVSINPDSGSLRLWENRCWAIPSGLDDGSNYSEDDDGVDALWTWLHFEGCNSKQKTAIKTAHEDAVGMAELVKTIDFANDHGAMEFFGPSYLNKDYQGSIQAIFEHISTFRLSDVWPGYRMNARCSTTLDEKYQDRCKNPGLAAYTWNTKTDADDPNKAPKYNKGDAVSNMHFCDQFFDYHTLDTVVDEMKEKDDFKWRYNVDKYRNQGYIMLHEFMHASVMTYEQNKNRWIADYQMRMYEYKQVSSSPARYKRSIVTRDIYKPYYCKVLARSAEESVVKNAISLNADNYAQYALAKYIQSKLPDKQYPWLPLADTEALEWWEKSSAALFYDTDGTFGVNADALPADITTYEDGDYSAYDLDDDDIIVSSADPATDVITSDADYTDSFNSQIKLWSSFVHTPDPECAKSGDSAPVGRSSFSAADADASIKDFCSDTNLYDVVFTPPISQGTGQTIDGKTKALGASGGYEINSGKDKLWVGAYFASGSCTGMYTWPPTGQGLRDTDLCLDRFRAIVNECDESTTKTKYGGSLQETCLVYQVMAVSSDESDPTGTISSGDRGDIICKDTDSLIGGKSTCTCWYENLPDQKEIFGLPKVGECADIDFRPAWTYYEDPDYEPEHIEPAGR
ncbi:hypothetical protein BJX65DRAFT_301996 [Aspergillus insuetus]